MENRDDSIPIERHKGCLKILDKLRTQGREGELGKQLFRQQRFSSPCGSL